MLMVTPAAHGQPSAQDPDEYVVRTMGTLLFCQTIDQFTADLLRVKTPRQAALQGLYRDTLADIETDLATAMAVPQETVVARVEQSRARLALDLLTRTETAGRAGQDSLRALMVSLVQVSRACEAMLRRTVEGG